MTQLKFKQLDNLPIIGDKGTMYILSNGDMYLGKSNGEFLQLNKHYIEQTLEELETSLTSTQRIIKVTDGQTSIPIDLIGYTPTSHIEFIFDNTTKMPKKDYTILSSLNALSGYEIVLTEPITNADSRLIELVLIHGRALVGNGDATNTMNNEVIDEILNRLELHELSQINSEQGLHGIRVWDGNFEQYNKEKDEWSNIVSTGAPTEHTHTIQEVDGLESELELKADKTSVDELTTSVGTLDTSLDTLNTSVDTLATTLNATSTQVANNAGELTGIRNQLANGVAPAIHTHPISAVNLLQDTLDSKANKTDLQTLGNNFNTHKHVITDVSELQTELDSKALKTDFNILKSNFDGHKHEISDVKLLTDTLANKAPLSHSHTWAQITGRPTATTTQIDSTVADSHLHSNMNILENLEDGNGVLIYNGSPLGEVAYVSVETIQDRDAIPVTARKEGLMALVIEDGGMYYLKGGIDNAFWQIFATGQGGATNASTLPASPTGGLTGLNTQSLIDQLETRKANKNDVYSKAEMTTFMENYPIEYGTLEGLPDLSQLHGHENLETLHLFNQYQGNLTWKGKSLGDLMTEIYDADKNGVIDKATKLDGQIATLAEINYLSGTTGNVQSQINALSSGVTFKGEYATYADMLDDIMTPNKGDLVYIKADENKGSAVDTQYCFDGTDWIYGGGTTKTPESTLTAKGIIQLGGDLAHPNSTASAPKLTPTGVAAGLYKSANITVDDGGRITYAEEGSVVFLNDTITSEDEGWSSNKINEELSKKADSVHTHAQLHDASMLGKIALDDSSVPDNNTVIAYDQNTGKAIWAPQQGSKINIGSKSIEGEFSLLAGSYISISVDEIEKTITLNSTYRENGGNVVPSGFEIYETVEVDANSSVRISTQSPFNKMMLHTVQMSNSLSNSSELRIYNQAHNENSIGYIEYHSNPESFISDIVNIPIFDSDNSKMVHFEVVNLGIERSKFKIRLKCTNLL